VLLGLARSAAMIWHTQIPELASLFHPMVATGETWSSV
jgi:hypothetical protein